MTGILWAVLQEPPSVRTRYCCGKPHHITLQYGAERESWEHLIGLPMTAIAAQEAWNDRIQAIQVVLPTWVSCQNVNPHISVSWVRDAAPVESNAMLANDYQSASVDFDCVSTIIEWVEWGDKPADPRKWRDRPSVPCPTCLRQGNTVMTRSISGYCRKHRN